MTDAIRKTIDVAATPDRAFATFTENVARWWPMDRHSVSAMVGKSARDVVFEPRVGGAAYEVMHDGERSDWGVIQRWEPGRAFGLTWHPGADGSRATRLDVEFAPLDDGRTRVTLIHAGWEVLAERADEARGHYSTGWDHVLGTCYGGVFQNAPG